MASKQAPATRAQRESVNEAMIGKLYGAQQHTIATVVAELSAEERATLAVFCYQRGHLREIGLAVAATCDQWSLANAAGKAGEALYASSRASHPALERTAPAGRRKITLATPIPSPPLVQHFDQDLEDDFIEDDLDERLEIHADHTAEVRIAREPEAIFAVAETVDA